MNESMGKKHLDTQVCSSTLSSKKLQTSLTQIFSGKSIYKAQPKLNVRIIFGGGEKNFSSLKIKVENQ